MEANSVIIGKLQASEAFPLDTLTVLAPHIHVSSYSTVYIRETVNRHYPLPSAGTAGDSEWSTLWSAEWLKE